MTRAARFICCHSARSHRFRLFVTGFVTAMMLIGCDQELAINDLATNPNDLTPERVKLALPWATSTGISEDQQFLASLDSTFATELVPADERNRFPYSAVGKLFTITEDFRVGWCSAFIAGKQAVITAAHCLYVGSEEDPHARVAIKQAFFIPQYDGVLDNIFYGTHSGVEPIWVKTGDPDMDVGWVGFDKPLDQVSRRLDCQQAQDPGEDIVIGYPAVQIPGYAFNGLKMWRTRGQRLRGCRQCPWNLVASNLTKGSSGGPWISGRTGRVNGLTSTLEIPEGDSEILRSPSTRSWKAMWDLAQCYPAPDHEPSKCDPTACMAGN